MMQHDENTLTHWLTLSQLPVSQRPEESALLTPGYPLAEYVKARAKTHPINQEAITASLRFLDNPQHHIITLHDPAYPEPLKNIHRPPCLLYIKGQVDTLALPQLSIVGSRHPTYQGKTLAHRLAEAMAQLGLCITSGLALGIDHQAHLGALSGGGPTVAVLGHGLNTLYPRAHKKTAERITETGCLVSTYPPNLGPRKHHFPERNRLISGLSLGTLIIEATIKSGSLITGHYALTQNREVMAIPGPLASPLSAGPHQLIQQGAALITGPNDILEALSLPTLETDWPEKTADTKKMSLSTTASTLLEHIPFCPIALSDLILQQSLDAASLTRELLNLQQHGYIIRTQRGYERIT